MPYAEAAAKKASELLSKVGYPKANQFVLLGAQATQGAIESRVRKLRKKIKKGDRVLVWFDAHGYSHRGASSLAVWDTLADDLLESGISIAKLVKDLSSTNADFFTCLLDAGLGPKPSNALPADVTESLDSTELDAIFSDHPRAVCLASTSDGEESRMASALQSGLWIYSVLEAFAGRRTQAISAEGTLTARTLQRHLEDELPRLLRKHGGERAQQTPMLYGANVDEPLADLAELLSSRSGGGLLDAERLKRITFRSSTRGRVKDLAGFRKSFRMPETASPSSKRFIAKCAQDDLRADLDKLYDRVRETMGSKRKDVETELSTDGTGHLRTPDFEYSITVELDATDPSCFDWMRELGRFSDAEFIRGPAFAALFGSTFDELHFEFATPVAVEELIDRLEDSPLLGSRLEVDSDGRGFEIQLEGYAGAVRVERTSLGILGRTGSAGGLLDLFLAFGQKVGPLGEPLALPGGKKPKGVG